MNLKYLFISTVLLAEIFLTGCLRTRSDLKDDEQRSTAQDQLKVLQKGQADTESRFSEIEEQLRNHNGRIELIEHKGGQQSANDDALKKSFNEQNLETQKKVALLQETIIKLESQVNILNQELAQIQNEKASASNSKSLTKDGGKKSSYETAQDLFNQKDWKKAILSYQKYRDDNPKGKHTADATYKIGVCFQELGMKDEAKTFFEEVSEKYPNSDEAKRSKIRLKSLKR